MTLIMIRTMMILLLCSGSLYGIGIKDHILNNISNDYDLVFFYSGSCHYCHQMAPALINISKKHGFRVVSNRLDGSIIPGFDDEISDINFFNALKVSSLPTTIAIHKRTNQRIVLATQALTEHELELTLLALHKMASGDSA